MAMTVEATQASVAIVLEVRGRVDGETAERFEQECHNWIQSGPMRVILDLSKMEYISSAGLGSVLNTGKKLDQRGGELVISGLSGQTERVFRFTGFDNLFKMFATAGEAMRYCETQTGDPDAPSRFRSGI
ncbi:MAG: STAS domain-containing protein [Bryobacteraceae bacterium]